MIKNYFLSLLIFSNLALVYSCSNNNSYGYLSAKVNFSQSFFSIKAIPANTYLILVSIKGVGLSDSITFQLSREINSKIIDIVPVGNKIITARAVDINSKTLAVGESSINIIANILNKAEIELKEENNNDLLNEKCTVFLDPKDNPLSSVTEEIIKNAGCEIILKDSSNSNQNSSQNSSSNLSVIPTPSSSNNPVTNNSTKEPCVVFINQADIPLSEVKEKIIRSAGCQIVLPSSNTIPSSPQPTVVIETPLPSPTPTVLITPTPSPTVTPFSGGNSNPSNPVESPIPTSSVDVNIDVIDGESIGDVRVED